MGFWVQVQSFEFGVYGLVWGLRGTFAVRPGMSSLRYAFKVEVVSWSNTSFCLGFSVLGLGVGCRVPGLRLGA